MKIIIGLGNPGPEYEGTRHNAGIDLVNIIYNSQFQIHPDTYGWRRKKEIMTAEFPGLTVIKTASVFMNESDKIINELRYTNYDLKDLYIAHDDLDIRLGEYKIQFGTGPKVHNGVTAIERAMGTKEFWRIRIGVDNRSVPGGGEEYVLQRFTGEERKTMDGTVRMVMEELL